MENIIKILTGFIAAALFIFAISYGSYSLYTFFAPRYAATQRKVFLETQGYNEGMIRDLENLKIQYLQTNDEGKETLKPIIIHRFSVYQRDRLPIDLQNFYSQIQGAL